MNANGKTHAPARAGTAWITALLLGAWVGAAIGATTITPGAPPHDSAIPEKHGSVTLEPGYYPPNDPESSSVRIGRRVNAPIVNDRFVGGAHSMEDLGRRVCSALRNNRADSLMMLALGEHEFRVIMWPELPQSRPATGIEWTDGWLFLYARVHAGCAHAARDWGGHVYHFVRFESESTQVFKNFKLHSGLTLVARDEFGQLQRMTWLRGVIERKGAFKIYSTDD
jgi:hypothetical protein